MRKNSRFSPCSFRPVVYGGLDSPRKIIIYPFAIFVSAIVSRSPLTLRRRLMQQNATLHKNVTNFVRRSGTRHRNTRPIFSSCNNLNYKFRLDARLRYGAINARHPFPFVVRFFYPPVVFRFTVIYRVVNG